MAGPKSVTIYDQDIVQHADLGSNFYIKESEVGNKTRAEASFKYLKQLNEYVEVSVHSGEVNTEFLGNFDVVCFTDCYDQEFLLEVNDFCRKREKAIGFIWSGALGLFGWTFVDFGEAHMVFDKDGEECLSTIITSISNDVKSIVTVNDDKRHGFQDGDWITFHEVEGMTEVNDKKFKIKVISPYSFSIGDTTQFGRYTRQGLAEQVKVPFPVKFTSLRDALEKPLAEGDTSMIDADLDFENMNKPYQYHFILKQVLRYHREHKKLPALLSETDAQDFEKICEEELAKLKEKQPVVVPEGQKPNLALEVSSLPPLLAKRISLFARTMFSPVASLWGGIIAQEVVKYTGKYSPIRPWFFYENYSFVLPENDDLKREVVEASRYRDQIALFGREAHERLSNQRVFMVGAGALGCEYLKMFALMGLGCGEKGQIDVTDDDTIALSNLNRQFLFRKEHVGSSKATTAVMIAKKMNPDLKAIAHKSRVSADHEKIFTDAYWDSLDLAVGAVDNLKARHYVDDKCVLHGKPLFDSGTLGTKCNSQIVLPGLTETYGDSQDPEEKSIPMCTLRNNPYLLDHTIEWARDYFQANFVSGSLEFSNFIKNPAAWIEAQRSATKKKDGKIKIGALKDKLEIIKKILPVYLDGASPQGVVNFARQLFQEIFTDQIAHLLHLFPRDYKDEHGNLFWSSPKRPPYVIDFDEKDDMHFLFIKSICIIISSCFGKRFAESDEAVHALLQTARFTVTPPDAGAKLDENGAPLEVGTEEEESVDLMVGPGSRSAKSWR